MLQSPDRINVTVSMGNLPSQKAEVAQATLSCVFDRQRLFTGVTENNTHTCLWIESLVYENALNNTRLRKTLKNVFETKKYFRLPWQQIKIAFHDNKCTLVPDDLFNLPCALNYLAFTHFLAEEETTMTDNLPIVSAKNIYAIPLPVKELLKIYFPQAKIYHYSTPLILTLTEQTQEEEINKIVFAHLLTPLMDIIVTEQNKLLYYNSFHCTTAEDFIYYVLFIYEQLNLNPESTPLTLLGEIDEKSPLFAVALQYIRYVRFGKRPSTLRYDKSLEHFASHHYFHLFALQSCAL